MTKNTPQRTPLASNTLGQPTGLFVDSPASDKPFNHPVHHIRHGAITASIWRLDTLKGPMFNVTFQRSYKDKVTDTWKTSSSFGRQNLLVLSLVAARAYEWINGQKAKRSAEADEPVRPL
jgi:hypothetical protein